MVPDARFFIRMLATVCFASSLPGVTNADFLYYTIPGSPIEMTLKGKSTVNPGGTVTYKHSRGTLHFKLENVRIVKSRETKALFAAKMRDAKAAGDVDSMLKVARWALHNGLLKEAKSVLGSAWRVDPQNPQLNKLAWMMKYINAQVPESPSVKKHMEEFLGSKSMRVLRSKHFLLMHDVSDTKDPITRKSRAEMRLELLELVYESYFLKFAFDGHFMRPPSEPLQVILFGRHADYLNFVTRLGPDLKQTAGFYSPQKNVSVFYDSATTGTYKALNDLSKMFDEMKAEIKRQRRRDAGDLIRFANTLDLLIDISRENEDIATVSHECTHQLAGNSTLIPRDALFVRWIQEGLAAYFESPKEASWSGIGSVNQDRLEYYRALEGDPVHGSLEYIVSDKSFLLQTNIQEHLAAYGQAWALTHFLMETRFEKLIEYYGKVAALPKEWSEGTPEQLVAAFTEVFGDMNRLEVEWRGYMRGLRTDIELLAE